MIYILRCHLRYVKGVNVGKRRFWRLLGRDWVRLHCYGLFGDIVGINVGGSFRRHGYNFKIFQEFTILVTKGIGNGLGVLGLNLMHSHIQPL